MNYLDKILKKAEIEHDKLKHPYVGTEHLLLALLSEDNELTNKLKEYNLTYNKFKRKLKEIIGEGTNKAPYTLYTPMLRKVINISDIDGNNINNEILFKSLLEVNEGIAIRIMETMNIDISELEIESNDLLCINDCPIEHREKEINEIFQILMRKNKSNPLLIGDAGVGKTAIVEEIQRRLINNQVPESLKGYKIINVDMSLLVAGTKYRGDFESKLNNLLSSVENSNKIIFIDEIHTLVHAGGAEGAISAGDIIKPFLSRGKIKCIGATTVNEYHEFFKTDAALNRRFQTVYINETSFNHTIDILDGIKNSYEQFHKIKIDKSLIKEIVNISNKYLINKHDPDRSIELLDSCCSNARFYNNNYVSLNNLYNIIENRYGINLKNEYIKNILDQKEILLTNKDIINKIKVLNNNLIIIDGNKYNSEDDLYYLLGNPLFKNNYYVLKEAIEKPLGLLLIINCNYNEILKESINKIINDRHIFDNHGNKISLDNYLIIMEKTNNQNIGFINNKNNNINYIEYDEKILLPI